MSKIKTIKDPNENSTVFTYNEPNSITTITDRCGKNWIVKYIESLNVWEEYQDPLGNTITNTFDGNRNLLTQTNPLGVVTSHTYDNNGDVLTTTISKDGVNYSFTDFQYDIYDNLIQSRGPVKDSSQTVELEKYKTIYRYYIAGIDAPQYAKRGNQRETYDLHDLLEHPIL